MNKKKDDSPNKYSLNEFLDQSDKSLHKRDGLISDNPKSEWPPTEMNPFAYRVVDWRGTHLAVVQSRPRAHILQRNPDIDPRLNWIYAIYPDETERLIQGGLSIMDDLKDDSLEVHWKESMQSLKINEEDIEETLHFYRRYKA